MERKTVLSTKDKSIIMAYGFPFPMLSETERYYVENSLLPPRKKSGEPRAPTAEYESLLKRRIKKRIDDAVQDLRLLRSKGWEVPPILPVGIGRGDLQVTPLPHIDPATLRDAKPDDAARDEEE